MVMERAGLVMAASCKSAGRAARLPKTVHDGESRRLRRRKGRI
ncbi:hypothetical protein SS05631_b58290 (plasmid) [Sinorhizobium sp. CCBAU 05631]|nr:hypothetical protein SS05631_b58290 [Sinorhizobium sp. CCBAU 05631]